MWRRSFSVVGALAMLLLSGAAWAQDKIELVVPNQGGALEGHTPRGFRGMGTGLFAGDNLNRGFPNGDGVQFFLSFDLSGLPDGAIDRAELRSDHLQVAGDPFGDLGVLRVETISYRQFSPDLWNQETTGEACVLAQTAVRPVACDVTAAVAEAVAGGQAMAQFRLRLDRASDSDGAADLAMFFISGSNNNEPGIFTLTVSLQPAK
ncbi:MAG: hypothetical protein ACTSWM_00035 [Alphaproteobacteria bacterium]